MEAIVSQVKTIAEGADDHDRVSIMNALRGLLVSLEKPEETMERISYAPLELYTAKIISDLGIYERLSSANSSIKLDTLAKETGADLTLLGRLMRYIASVKMVDEVEVATFSANDATRALGTPKGKSYINVYYELVTPVFHMLPTFLAKNQYMNPTDSLKVPFQDAFGFSGDMFAFWKAFPKFGDLFDTHMGFQRDSSTDFLSVFKVMQEGKNILDDDVAFVDLGGGVGHQSARLKAICPDLPGRVILQDLPHVLDRALSTPGVEKLPCNLLELPPTKDAKFYYMRGVLHDFPDDKCQLILSNIAAAMANDSVLLVDEMVLPDKNIHWQAASMDLQMLSYLGSQERTRSHWSELTRSVGLSIQNVYFHKPTAYESLLVLIKDHRPISV